MRSLDLETQVEAAKHTEHPSKLLSLRFLCFILWVFIESIKTSDLGKTRLFSRWNVWRMLARPSFRAPRRLKAGRQFKSFNLGLALALSLILSRSKIKIKIKRGNGFRDSIPAILKRFTKV